MEADEERVRRERDLYRRLLGLGDQEALEPFLKEALAFLVDVSGARRGYLEVVGDGGPGDDPVWSAVEGVSRRRWSRSGPRCRTGSWPRRSRPER